MLCPQRDNRNLTFLLPSRERWTLDLSLQQSRMWHHRAIQSEFWFQVVQQARLQPASWCVPQACADLLARVESGEIDVSITDFEGAVS